MTQQESLLFVSAFVLGQGGCACVLSSNQVKRRWCKREALPGLLLAGQEAPAKRKQVALWAT